MIIDFSITNFRSIKDKVTLSFEPENSSDLEKYYIIEPVPGLKLLKLGLIYGANGSGKTTILRALSFLRTIIMKPAEKKTAKLKFKPFLFDENTRNENSLFELSFVHQGIRFLYNITFNQDSVVYESLHFYSPNKALVYERHTDTIKQLANIEFGNKIKLNKVQKSILEGNTLWNITVLSGFLRTNIESIELKIVTDWFNDVLKGIVTPKATLKNYITNKIENEEINKNHILHFLKKADFKLSDLTIEKSEKLTGEKYAEVINFLKSEIAQIDENIRIKEEPTESSEIIFQHSVIDNEKELLFGLPYSEESEGTQRYYQFSGVLDLLLTTETIFPIDEIESSLHPDLVKHFLLVFLVNSKKSQLIATTHHRELLADRDIFRDDVIWFTEKKSNGSMDLFSLNDFDSTVIRNTTSVYNAYKSGKLGAVPELGDYYIDLENE